MDTVLFVKASIGFSENLFLVIGSMRVEKNCKYLYVTHKLSNKRQKQANISLLRSEVQILFSYRVNY